MNRTIGILSALLLTALVGVGAVYYYVKAQQARTQDVLVPTAAAYRHLTAEVNISGTVKAADAVDLAFKNGGIVEAVEAITGKPVFAGSILITLRSNMIKDQLSQSQANLVAELAKLRDLENGTRPEQIAVTQAQLASGETTFRSAERGLFDALSNAQSVSDVAIRFTADQFITNPTVSSSQINMPVTDNQLGSRVLAERLQINPDLSSWNARIVSLRSASTSDLLLAGTSMHTYLQTVSMILDGLTRILAANSSAQYAASQTSVAAARTTVISANDALTAAEQKVLDAQAAVAVTKQKLALEKAGSTSEAIAAEQAIVQSIQAQGAELEDELHDQSIKAPFSGVITDVTAKQGEAVAAGEVVVSMISNGKLKVEGYVPEIHYSEIAIGQPVRIQLDAFPGVSFPGTLGLIDPSAVLRGGVPNFKVTMYFINPDSRVKPGLTANAFIQTGDKPNVLAIPIAAVTGTGATASVLRATGTASKRTPVTLGITGVDGYVEVLEGLAEGDTVLVNGTKQYRIVPN